MALFAFGCSFTQYDWPTWADIVGKQFDYYENWGQRGGGNQFIFNSLLECVVKNKISKDDTVIVMWTNVAREDRYLEGKWVTPGHIYTQFTYDHEFVKKFADIRGYFIRDFNTIFAAQNILKNIGCKFYFLSMVPLTNPYQYFFNDQVHRINDVAPWFESTLQQIKPSIFEIVFDLDWDSRPFTVENVAVPARSKRVDSHPTPLEHLEYLEKILPEIAISKTTADWVSAMDADVRSGKCKWAQQCPERW